MEHAEEVYSSMHCGLNITRNVSQNPIVTLQYIAVDKV
jgi:hypothetical protein